MNSQSIAPLTIDETKQMSAAKGRGSRNTGVTLIEVMAAVIIAAAAATVGIQYLRPAGDTSKQRSCDMTRELLQSDAQRYMETAAQLPSTDLRELRTAQYAGPVLPSCPITGDAYRRNRTGIVGCPTHEPTRER